MDIEKKAYHEGYEQGIKNGYEDGYKEAYEDNIEKAKSESSQILEKANKVILEANNQIASYINENKKRRSSAWSCASGTDTTGHSDYDHLSDPDGIQPN